MSLADRSIAFLTEHSSTYHARLRDLVCKYAFDVLDASEVEMWSSVFGDTNSFTDTLNATATNPHPNATASVLTRDELSKRLRRHVQIEFAPASAMDVGGLSPPCVIVGFKAGTVFTPEQCETVRKVLEKIASDTFHFGARRIHELMINASHQSKDLTSFLHRAINQVLIPEFHVQAASVFYYEHKTRSLILGATTGIPRQEQFGLKRSDVRYFSDSKSYTARCWKSGQEIVENIHVTRPLRPNTNGEHPRAIYSRVNAPLRRWIDRKAGMPDIRIGVVRALNFNADANFHPLTNFEATRLRVFCDSASVLTERYIRTLSILHDQERATHGYNTDLAAIRYAAQNTERWLERVSDTAEPADVAAALQEVRYRVRDILAVQDNMASQILTVMHHSGSTRMVARQAESQPCHQPYTDVIMRLVHAKKGMSECYARTELRLNFGGQTKADDAYIKIPALKITIGSLYLVFRNLAENAIKYSVKGTRPTLDISWQHSGDLVTFSFKDNGIGIPKGEHHLVLREGFRGRTAQELQLRGNGLGLAVSQSMLRAVGGELKFVPNEPGARGARFEVIVPALGRIA